MTVMAQEAKARERGSRPHGYTPSRQDHHPPESLMIRILNPHSPFPWGGHSSSASPLTTDIHGLSVATRYQGDARHQATSNYLRLKKRQQRTKKAGCSCSLAPVVQWHSFSAETSVFIQHRGSAQSEHLSQC